MQYSNKLFNVLTRGKHTLFVVAQMDGKRKRDPDKLRLQIANMLSVEPRLIVANHDYDGLPEGRWFCFRFKAALPPRLRRPSVGEDRHRFVAKSSVLNFIIEDEPKPKQAKERNIMPGSEEAVREGDTPTIPPISSSDITMLLLQRQMAQDELLTQVLKNQQYLAEIVGQMALKL